MNSSFPMGSAEKLKLKEECVKVDAVENAHINAIIEAALQADWLSFQPLSDEPFSNEEAMKEMFEMCSVALRAMSGIKVKATAQLAPDGARMIHGTLTEVNRTTPKISLIVRSIRAEDCHKFGIWVFAPMPEL